MPNIFIHFFISIICFIGSFIFCNFGAEIFLGKEEFKNLKSNASFLEKFSGLFVMKSHNKKSIFLKIYSIFFILISLYTLVLFILYLITKNPLFHYLYIWGVVIWIWEFLARTLMYPFVVWILTKKKEKK